MRVLLLAALSFALAACGPDPDSAVDATPEVPAADAGPVAGRQTAYDVAAANPSLTTFIDLVDAAGLADALRDTSQVLTVFAPSNAAFNALGAVALAALRDDPAALRERLRAHVLATRMLSGDIFGELSIASLAGSDLTLDANDVGVTVTGAGGATATVTDADLDAENGVVHVIDTVLSGPTASPDA